MKKETYVKIFKTLDTIGVPGDFYNIIGKLITIFTIVSYFIMIAQNIYFMRRMEVIILIFIPFISFVMVSVFRKFCSAKRPYEIYDFKPLIRKETVGKSFPSRHVFSISVIAVTLFYFNVYLSIVLSVLTVILGIIRVITGVHFPKDVICGGLMGLFFGVIANILFNCL